MKKILIIDDDPRNIFALKAVLKSKGYECLTVAGAQEGIDILRSSDDMGIVLLDMMMPEMDGYEAIPLIKKEKDVPIVAVTAQAMVGDREKCLNAGANEYISKPVNIDVLMPILEQHLK